MKNRLDDDGELERHCPRCDEWWPADNEFFFTSGTGRKKGLHTWCKACYLEYRKAGRQREKLVAVA